MRRPARVDIHLKRGIFPNQSAGRTGVVQMNVRQQNRIQVSDAKMVQGELLAQCAERRTRPRVDDCGKMLGAQQRRGYAPGLPGPVQVQQSRGNHS